ncbi:hypothetical protein GF402_10115 [Candidatus Fermentibacteria bacterium]|nr:hypothetical protein [Candidatus Fermentibacteria bacterium]
MTPAELLGNPDLFRFDELSKFVGLFTGLFFLLVVIYSIGYMRGRRKLGKYYLYTLLTLIASLGAIFANNMILFLSFWGFLGLLLYQLITFGRTERTGSTAKKAFVIIGGTDALMLLGIVILWRLSGESQTGALFSLRMDALSVDLGSRASVVAYVCLAAGALAKAGAMPFHTWVPDTAEDAPIPVTAYLPASLDKLLGIYFLARISLGLFEMTGAMNTVLMAVGSFTIVAAVMMALIQHDMKRLLGYHAVSQVGYMVLGIGTGNPIGIAGGIFHMLNHAIYKSCLFLSGGAVAKRAGTSDLSKLGGYARVMPVTFITFLVASLSISGVPPFNGFASKWLVYQGVIETGRSGGYIWILWLVAAMFGSILTLASFMKLIHAIFLGQSSERTAKSEGRGETGASMWIPTVILSILCVVFGVFAISIPLKHFVYPSVPGEVAPVGIWSSGVVTLLLIAGVILGFVIYLLGALLKSRTTGSFIGGETLEEHEDMRVSGVEFYDTVRDNGLLRGIYRAAERKLFDIYDLGAGFAGGLGRMLGLLHDGVLSRYVSWFLLGTLVLIWYLMR